MSRLLPRSLFGQLLLILLAGLIISHVIGAWLYSTNREEAVRAVGGLATAQRIVNLTRLVQGAPNDWRGRIIAASSDQSFHVALLAQEPDFHGEAGRGPVAIAVHNYLVDRLKLDAAHAPLVLATQPYGPSFGPWGLPFMHHGPMMMGGPIGRPGPRLVDLEVAVPLTSGGWLTFSTALPQAGDLFSRQFIVAMAIMAVVLIGAAIWATRRVTKPLASLAEAAQRLGKDVNAPPIPEVGSIETRQASHAFNEMQIQLRELIENRTRLFAAISHDLRTPLTLLRLRTETVPDAEEKEKMLATIAEMDAMVSATLQYARDELATEPVRTTDLAALVQSAVDDLADAGLDVAMTPSAPILVECQPTALKRAVTNLAHNAATYGTRARVSLPTAADAIDITIDDDGPGLSDDELARVFQPFYRVEGSRSRDTGGVGLGLAIAKSLVEKHGGTLRLSNRAGGGLRARVSLPKSLLRKA